MTRRNNYHWIIALIVLLSLRTRSADPSKTADASARQTRPEWRPAGPLLLPSIGHAGVLLRDGRLLVIGGSSYHGSAPSNTAVIFDPQTDQWRQAASFTVPRGVRDSAVLLESGRVMLAGGGRVRPDGTFQNYPWVDLYDPERDTWVATGQLNVARRSGALVRMTNGHVLYIGGATGAFPDKSRFLDSVEEYDPRAGTWRMLPEKLAIAREAPQAVGLQDGRVLVMGGEGPQSPALAVAEVFDPAAGRWSRTAAMKVGRSNHRAIRLFDGRVLVAGGYNNLYRPIAGSEIYDPATDRWTETASMSRPRDTHTLHLLMDGRVLAIGGTKDVFGHFTELYDPKAGTWEPFAPLGTGDRMSHISQSLDDGTIVVAGGYAEDALSGVLDSTERLFGVNAWNPGLATPTSVPPTPTPTEGPSPTPAADVPDRCADALRAVPGTDLYSTIERTEDIDVFRVDVAQPFSRVTVVLNPSAGLDLYFYRGCGVAGSGSGRHVGAGSGRHVGGEIRLTFDTLSQTGSFYIDVQSAPEATAFPLPFKLRVKVETVDPSSRRALILTHLPDIQNRFADDPQLVALQDRLRTLSDQVNGVLVTDLDAGTNDAVRKAHAQWRQGLRSPAQANRVAEALRDWIWQLRQQYGQLNYIVLVGDDGVIPHYRLPIAPSSGQDSNWLSEAAYFQEGRIGPGTPLADALVADSTLTDDVFTAPKNVPWGTGQAMFVPEIAVGRLVESPSEMVAAIDSYLVTRGNSTIATSLAAGWDFMADGVAEIDRALAAGGVPDSARLQVLGDDRPLEDLALPWFRQRFDLMALGVHANHALYQTPRSGEIRTADLRLRVRDLAGTLGLALACHGGLSVPDRPGPHPMPEDFPQAWLSRGATYVGSSGWAYGTLKTVGYQEELMVTLVEELTKGGPIAIGDAMVNAKQRYYHDHALNHYHAKSLAGTILYGLPMTRFSTTAQAEVSLQRRGTPKLTMSSRTQARLSSAPAEKVSDDAGGDTLRATVTLHLPGHDQLERVVDQPTGASYLQFRGAQPYAETGRAIVPMMRQTIGEVEYGDRTLPPRGVVMLRASYLQHEAQEPVIERSELMAAGPRRMAQDGDPELPFSRWWPTVPLMLQRLDHAPGVGAYIESQRWARLLVYVGQFSVADQSLRLLSGAVTLDQYFSDSKDVSPPIVERVQVGTNGDMMTVRVQASDDSAVMRVLALCDDGRGDWTTTDLVTIGGEDWTGGLARGQACVVQVVDAAGNVTVDDNETRLYGDGALKWPQIYLPSLAQW